jgi:molybdate/tungstate transport system permease protein
MDRLQLYAISVALFYFSFLTIPAIIRYQLILAEEYVQALMNTATAATLSTLMVLSVAALTAQGSLSGLGKVAVPLVTATASVPHTAVGVLLAPLVFGAGISDTTVAIVLAMAVVSLPIGFTVIRGAIASLGLGYFEFLRSMGLSGFRMTAVTLRSVRTAVLLAFLLSWFRAFSELGALLIVARRPLTVGVYIYEFFLSRGTEYVVGGALVLVLLSLMVGFGIARLERDAGGR